MTMIILKDKYTLISRKGSNKKGFLIDCPILQFSLIKKKLKKKVKAQKKIEHISPPYVRFAICQCT